jgi:hypothetical protein
MVANLARKRRETTIVVPGLMRTGFYMQACFKDQLESGFTWFALGAHCC